MSEMRGCRKEKLKVKQLISGWKSTWPKTLFLARWRIEELALEGLRIQMGSGGRAAAEGEKKDAGKKCVVLVTRIKMRDPEAEYDAVGRRCWGSWRCHRRRRGGGSTLWKGCAWLGYPGMEREDLSWDCSLGGEEGASRQWPLELREEEDIPFCQAK
ncbi:hypothetical protein HPP92_011468 [Vanilla planifolia]|uniref:Uncharacterized protein n=1 Tax=Vanilla planifolia TaxID=51239 RepID=A0A835V1U3_VANPL|nr:hypothetical protein HPP92_011468 [Vanilla planifolia]